jgi:hypothetical protein
MRLVSKTSKPSPADAAAAADARAQRRAKRAEAQRRRRSLERVTEAESFEEASARLREAFGKLDADATHAAPAAPPADLPLASEAAPSAAKQDGSPLPPPGLPTPGTPEPQKPEGEASPPAGEAKADAHGAPNPFGDISLDQMASIAVDAVDDVAVSKLGTVPLKREERELLSKAAGPVLAEALAPAGRQMSPADVLWASVLMIYGPRMLPVVADFLGFGPKEEAPASSRTVTVPAVRAVPG